MSKSEKMSSQHFNGIWKSTLYLTAIVFVMGIILITLVSFLLTLSPSPEKFYEIAKLVVFGFAGFIGGKLYFKKTKENVLLISLFSSLLIILLVFLASLTLNGSIMSYLNLSTNFLTVFLFLMIGAISKSNKSRKKRKRKI